MIFSEQEYKTLDIPKCFQNVQLFDVKPIKCLNVYADS